MKKWFMFTAAAVLFFISGVVVADSINGNYNGNPIVKVTLQGKEIPAQDVPAQILDGRTMVPLYYLQSMGYTLNWDQSTYSVDIKPTQQAAGRRKLSSEEIAKLADRVGLLLAYNDQGVPYAQGSAFIITKDGLMISANHAYKGSAKMDYVNNGFDSYFTSALFTNDAADVFATRLGDLQSNKGRAFPYLDYSTELPQVGQKVYAIGYPRNQFTISEGNVSSIDERNGIKIIRHSAPTDHGSSGGVLLNEYGEAIGITVSGIDETQTFNYAIPMMYVQQEIDKLHK